MSRAPEVIDDLAGTGFAAANGQSWQLLSDRVMGGVSGGEMTRAMLDGRRCQRMTGQVRLDNNGGFLQMALDLAPAGGSLDARAWRGLRLVVRGNGEAYGLHLRTPQAVRPWQSWRQGFVAPPRWTVIALPFDGFRAHRIEAELDIARLRRLGLVAIGRAFAADLALADLRFYA